MGVISHPTYLPPINIKERMNSKNHLIMSFMAEPPFWLLKMYWELLSLQKQNHP
jgi:hypothetical protein